MTLSRRLKLVSESLVKNSEIVTTHGTKLVSLYPAEVLSDLAFEFDLALAKLMNKAGASVYLYGLGGYEVKASAIAPPPQPKSLNEILLAEVYAEVDRLAYNPTQAYGVKVTIPQYLDELDASSSHTALTGLWMALTRLKLEEGTCNPIQLHRTIHKQLRQVQIRLEGITSVHDSLLTGKELKDKSKALELNPSSKQHLLPEVPTLAH
jgi:hypothetical protein